MNTPILRHASFWGVALGLILSYFPNHAAELVPNGGFESGLENWRPFWSRAPNSGASTLDPNHAHSGQNALLIEHLGTLDWSVEPTARVPAQPGEIFTLEAWIKLAADANVTLCVSTWDSQGKVINWSFAERNPTQGQDWQHVRTVFVTPIGVSHLQPRLIGYGPVRAWVDDVVLTQQGSAKSNWDAPRSQPLLLESPALAVEVRPAEGGTLHVLDKQSGKAFRQRALSGELLVQGARSTNSQITLDLLQAAGGLAIQATFRLDGRELEVELQGRGELHPSLPYPHPFEAEPGDYLVVPMNEGISYPIEDDSIPLHRLIAYGGHGISMAFFGSTDGVRGWMGILETPDDAAIRLNRVDGRLIISPEWDPQQRQFGYTRKLRYIFLDQGGHVAIAKRYRAHARQTGLLKTLEEKRRANPNVDLLLGAANIWCWDKDAVPLVREMQEAGIDRILWSNRQTPTNLHALNQLGVLTSRYDIYQDAMNPKEFSRLRWIHPDWTTNAWPQDLITGAHGRLLQGWGVETKGDDMVHCGVLCDRRALVYARERIPAELASHPYRCRFIDTTTAAPWNECYDPLHPMTRSESRRWKMDLLRYVSEEAGLVTGCETGHDAAVPFLHYFEGMLSLGPYRVPDSGRRMSVIWTNVPPDVAKFQLGHAYRLPLWELVYHDCVVAQWYWGDYNNKLPALWEKRDLFNALYGTPPMFMFDRKLWEKEKARFVRSYQNTAPIARRTAYAEMTNHRFLTPDRSVQQTTFANGTTVTVNFGSTPFAMANGRTLPPSGLDLADAPVQPTTRQP